ncbi:tRNA-specific adenosine deaminase 1-like [Lineus longissimus]|uniref:tRNA-specific adenosine deaminase 1-like n=1 Tax=Lineus longissimus TaxID=88925 RepID=UPI002B4DCDDA
MFQAEDLADTIAKCSYDHYGDLPRKGKPQEGKEWTLLAAIVQETEQDDTSVFQVVAMGTGTKCLGQSKMSKIGDIVNDSHAEVIARRAFLNYLLYHVEGFYETGSSEIFTVDEKTLRFSIEKGIAFHFFTSHTPCGDASIFPKEKSEGSMCETGAKRTWEGDDLNMKKRHKLVHSDSDVDSCQVTTCRNESLSDVCPTVNDMAEVTIRDIYRTGAKCVSSEDNDPLLGGMEYHRTGLLRTKPGRGERTLSMCCSDKLAKWNVVGCQGALLSHLFEPVYFKSFVVGSCPYDKAAMTRALVSRCLDVSGLQLPYILHQPLILQSTLEFEDSKHIVEAKVEKAVSSNTSIIWSSIPCRPIEVSVNGKRQGITTKNIHKSQARCSICKAELFSKFKKVIEMVGVDRLPETLRCPNLKTYHDFKEAADGYQLAWGRLLNVFKDWRRAPRELENFTLDDLS